MTSGNGTANNNDDDDDNKSTSRQHNGEANAAQAIVKTNILTHLIEGFVIQEGAEPFPVERPSFSVDCLRRHAADSRMDGLVAKELKSHHEPMLTCELCGREDFAYIFKRSKRFCSTGCAKRYNVGCTKRIGLFPNRKTSMENIKRQRALNAALKNCTVDPKKKKPPAACAAAPSTGHSPLPAQQAESSQCSDLSGYKRPPAPQGSPCHYDLVPGDPGQWDIQDVHQFISSLPGCLEIAEEFRSQEIDGQALLLLKEDHLMGTMNIKLGPALKIFAQISMLRDS